MKPVICYLASSDGARRAQLWKSLKFLYRSFNAHARCPVKVFVEPDFPEADAHLLQLHFPRLETVRVTLFDPQVPVLDSFPCGPGYRRMCHFMFAGIQEHLAEFDAYLRLDTDSFILDTMGDPFARMTKAGAVYGYLTEDLDDESTCVGAGEFFQNLAAQRQTYFLDSLFEDGKYTRRLFYNNFEVVDLHWWRRPDVQELVRAVVESDNIFRWRWGDHLCRTFLLAITVPREQVLRLTGVDYVHWPFVQIGDMVRGVSAGCMTKHDTEASDCVGICPISKTEPQD